jgi:hypothetical protein
MSGRILQDCDCIKGIDQMKNSFLNYFGWKALLAAFISFKDLSWIP